MTNNLPERLENTTELTKLNITYENGQPVVSARELHEKLKIKTKFATWFPRMADYGFSENEDYKAITQKWVTAQNNETTSIDYQVSIDMAKQICMIQRTELGKKYRQYFLDLEKAWNSPEQVMARALKLADQTIASLEEKVESLEDTVQAQNLTIEQKDEQIQEQQERIEDLEETEKDWKTLMDAQGTFSINQLSQFINIGEYTLFSYLRKLKVLFKNENNDNVPYRQHLSSGKFAVIPAVAPNGVVHSQTRVYPEGIPYITRLLRKNGYLI